MDIKLVAIITGILVFIVFIVSIYKTIRHFMYLEDQLSQLNYMQLVRRLSYVNNLLVKEQKKKLDYDFRIESSIMHGEDWNMFHKVTKRIHIYSHRIRRIHRIINRKY